MGAKRSLKSNAVALAEVCKANDERTFARMRGNDVDAPITDLHALTSYFAKFGPEANQASIGLGSKVVWQSIRRATRRVDGVMISQAASSTWAAAGTCWRV